jgi:hypothetical protein
MTQLAVRLSGAARRRGFAALEREIDQLARLDVALTDQAGDGVHDEFTSAAALLQVKVQARAAAA